MGLSTKSKAKLNTCHSDLIKLIEAVAETEKCAVICGHRGKAEQEKAFWVRKSWQKQKSWV